jgi:hypothetical protein
MRKKTKRMLMRMGRSFLPRLFGEKKLLLAFEYGLAISETAKEMKIELTPEIVNRAEGILMVNCIMENSEHVALNMLPNILASFEPKEDN